MKQRVIRLSLMILGIGPFLAEASFGQEFVYFSNRGLLSGNSQVAFLDGRGVGAGFTAQLFGGSPGTPLSQLTPLLPTTTFRTSSEAALGYLNAVKVPVPRGLIGPDRSVTLVMRVYDGVSWETSNCRGESNPVIVVPMSATAPVAMLDGLQPFQVDCIPELGAGVLLALGLGALAASRFFQHPAQTRWNRALG